MAAFVHFFRLTPQQFWDLELEDYDALGRYLDRYNKEQSKG